jgi:hypothetical protein
MPRLDAHLPSARDRCRLPPMLPKLPKLLMRAETAQQ